MNRSLTSVLVGTFTLRFSTGLTGAMLAFYLARLNEFHPDADPVSPITVGLFSATFFVAELILSPIFGILSDRYGHHRVMLFGPMFGAAAVLLTAATGNPTAGRERGSSSAPGDELGGEQPAKAKAPNPHMCVRTRGLQKKSGSDLLSRAVSRGVPSALEGLTSVFGMGTGVTPPT